MAALAFSWLCWTLTATAAAAASSSADEQNFTHRPGMNVTLTFRVPTGTTSVWLIRPGSDKYIFYCQDRRPTRLSDQEESFKGRVEGMDCDKINGTVSVTVRNLTTSDNGTYEFHRVDSDGRHFNETTFLNVTDPGPPEESKDGGEEEAGSVGLRVGLSVSFGLLLVGVAGFWIYRRCRKRNGQDPNQPPDEQQLDSESLDSLDRGLQTCKEKLLMEVVS